MPVVAELLREASRRLAAAGIESPQLDAEVLMRHVLGIDRTHLFLRLQEENEPSEVASFNALIEQRLQGPPIAYLTGEREFMGLTFQVGPGVLVPRPETELLVEWALTRIGHYRPANVVDVGTGSGAIILSVAHHLDPHLQVVLTGTDRSADALWYAARNRERLGLASRVNLVQGDLLNWTSGPIDLVLANLPYLRPEQVMDNPDIQFEPEIALVSGEDGFIAIAQLIADLPRVMASGGAAILELDPDQAERAASAMSAGSAGVSATIIRDLTGRDRFVVAEFE
jgi:release factor glutamine methyltransferase